MKYLIACLAFVAGCGAGPQSGSHSPPAATPVTTSVCLGEPGQYAVFDGVNSWLVVVKKRHHKQEMKCTYYLLDKTGEKRD